jgi:histidinol dehydrogenase
MKVRRFDLKGEYDAKTAAAMRDWAKASIERVDRESLRSIHREVVDEGDDAVMRLTERFDTGGTRLESLTVSRSEAERSLAERDAPLREALETAASNIRAVAEAQLESEPRTVRLPQGHTVTIRDVATKAAGVYAPGGRAVYPSTVLMCAIPARVAGVERIALASPPDRDGHLDPVVLAAAALCDVDEIYTMGGAQAIFALAHGTETIEAVDVIVGPGTAWVQEAKRRVNGFVGIDSYAGPSELMVIAGHDADPDWIALDLCAQAEHGGTGSLIVAAVEEHVLDAIESATLRAAKRCPSVGDAPLALVHVLDAEAAVDLANAYAPEHLELAEEDAVLLADRVTTAGCVFAGRYSATAFGDYVAGSNHVLPTLRNGRFSGPLGPGTFRRKIATVEVSAEAAAKLAPHVKTLAEAEGFPVHGESAMIRAKDA